MCDIGHIFIFYLHFYLFFAISYLSFYLYVEKAKVSKCRFHDLRHTFATRLVQAGVDLYKVQKLMRHKSPVMIQRYAHHYAESLRDGVEVLDKNYHIFITGQEKGATANAVTP